MNEEKQIILKRIDELINKRKTEMLKNLPSIHEINDGIIVRFFTKWDNCIDDSEIKFKKIESDNPNETIMFHYLPKGSDFDLKQRFFIENIICLSGKMDVFVNGETILVENYRKICINSNNIGGKVYENTYLLTINNKSELS